jgi:protein-disulfide isomerase
MSEQTHRATSSMKIWIWLFAALAVVALSATYWFMPRESAVALEFRERMFPPGTRDLVLEQGLSPFNSALSPRQLERIGERFKPNPAQICRLLYRDVSSPSAGAPDHPVQIISFLDYRCPYCKTLSNIMAGLHDDTTRFIYREWPILGDASVLTARAALAADRQGKYLAFHNRMMNTRLIPTPALIDNVAAEVGLDVDKLHADMNSEATLQSIRQTASLASALGLTGTPVLVVGRTIVQGDITRSQLEKLIAEERSLPPMKDC